MTRSVPELLAPAGSRDALESACAAGADAIYLGASRFGARASAGFNETALAEAIEYAHARDVRVYVTINTLITEQELCAVADELIAVYSAGADAMLVQDSGVASLARELVPTLPLHASTQMTVHSADSARAAMELGCTRVVLSRELNLDEVDTIAAEVPAMELEVFAHGALCYGWSGQCLFSSSIGGRSGNRGRCAQPCRKPYRLVAGAVDDWGRISDPKPVPLDDRYLLSPRDLWTYPEIEQLVKMPITALKIEGRLRSPSYVGTVVSAYRQALDMAAQGKFVPDPAALELLSLEFNRGFTRGRLFQEPDPSVMGRDRPGPRGVRIGTVAGTDQVGRTRIHLDGKIRPRVGDGLVIAPPGRPDEDIGTVLRRNPEGSYLTLSLHVPVPGGAPVYLTRRAGEKPGRTSERVPITGSLLVDSFGRPTFTGTVLRRRAPPVPFQYTGEPFIPARSRPIDRGTLEAHLSRTGGTAYRFDPIEIDIHGEHFAPVSVLNALRRHILEAASNALIEQGRPSETDRCQAVRRRTTLTLPSTEARREQVGPPPIIRVIADTAEVAKGAARAGADEVCLEAPGGCSPTCTRGRPGSMDLVEWLDLASRACAGVPIVWKWPRITRQAFLDAALPALGEAPITGVLVEGLGAAKAVGRTAPGLSIHGGPGINLWNSRTASVLSSHFASLTLSPELSGYEIRGVTRASRSLGLDVPFALQVQGNLEVLITEDCVMALAGCPPPEKTRFAIEDGTHRRFPVFPDPGGRTRIQNADETSLVAHVPAIVSASIGIIVIDARGRTPAYVVHVVNAYRRAIETLVLPLSERKERLEALHASLRLVAEGGTTVGPFLRGRREE